MRREFKRWISIKTLIYLAYLPVIICKIKNWPTYLLNYLGVKNEEGKYCFRDGIVLSDKEGSVTGIIAVVFIRKHYGEIKNMSVIVDIGANIGVFSVYAANESQEAIIYAFEPVRMNYEILNENINNNNFSDRIKAFNLGIASKNESRKIYMSTSTLHSITNANKNQYHETIQCITLNDIIITNKLNNIDLLKINCEGAEYEILYSTNKESFDVINEIRLEYHNEDSDRNNVVYLKKYLESMGYQELKLWENSKEDGFLWLKRKSDKNIVR